MQCTTLLRLCPDRVRFPAVSSLICTLVIVTLMIPTHSLAQAAPITPSGLNTQVNLSATPPVGKVQYDITGGTRPGGGTNLFHSFGEFGVPTNNIANFLNETPAIQTSNILGRVTGGNTSNIFGTIQTTGFGNANLFLMNPAGFLFGPNATVNVGGMVAFTSADYLKLTDNARFNAIPNAGADALLTALPVASFGFLGSNPGAITVQGSQFTVTQGTGISLVGGNITIQSGTLDDGTVQPAKLTAPAGQITLASVASAGEILSSNLQLGVNVNGESFTSLGSITISQDAHIDTAGATGGTIAIRGGQLTIKDGATIASAASSNPSAPAGSVAINGAGAQMTGSDVVINGTNVSVTGSRVTAVNLDGSGGTITVTAGSADHPGNVTVAQNALLDASGTSGGTITIRGKQLVMDNATISANTAETNGAPVAIDVDVSGDLVITNNSAPAFTAWSTGAGDAGSIHLKSGGLTATSIPNGGLPFSLIESYTVGSGKAGSVHLKSGELNVATDPSSPVVFIDSGTRGLGKGGDVTIEAGRATFSSTEINTGDVILGGSGSAGNISIRSDSLSLKTTTFSADSQNARGGDVTLDARSIALTNNSFIDVLSLEGGSAIHITADHLAVDGVSSILNQTALEPGGGIFITAKTVEVTNNSAIVSQTFGDGDAGNIHVTATDHITLADDPVSGFKPSGFYTNSFGDSGLGTHGNAGAIDITTPRLTMTGGARINSTTQSSGRGGDVTVTAHDVTLSGQRTFEDLSELFGLGGTKATGIYTRTVGSEFCAGSCGDAGHVTINTGSLAVNGGAVIDSGTTNNGQGGSVSVNATDRTSISGTMNDGAPGGVFSRTVGMAPDSGSGGNIALAAGQSFTISNGASVSASSKGPGSTGNIQIDAGQSFVATNYSTVMTEANQASGGTIKITTTPNGTVQLTNSTISASVLDGTGGGGSVNIDPQFVILQNSQILAQANQGPGGNIFITTNLLLPDANSVISASSQFGVNGTVTIQSPNDPAGGKIQPLGKSPLQATSLLNQRCASLAGGEFSSFTVAGRDSLPTEPSSWLASPLVLGPAGFSAGTVTEGGEQARVVDPAHETTVLSLRQIAPAGFLTQAFAVDWSASCQS